MGNARKTRFAKGAVGSFEATRFASGRKNAIRLEINGSDGSLAFDFESMNELHVYDATVMPPVKKGDSVKLRDEPGWTPERILVTTQQALSEDVIAETLREDPERFWRQGWSTSWC